MSVFAYTFLMFQTVFIHNTQDSHRIFEESYYKKNITWVVSDLTSKLSFQKKIFVKQSVIPDESLLRAQELWFKLFARSYPDYKLVSKECILFFTQKFIFESEHKWAHRKGTAQLTLHYLQLLMPILCDQNGHDMMKEFFTKQVPSYERWGHWYLLCHDIFQKFMQLKMVHPQWIPAFLIHQSEFHWERDLVVDLGAQLQPLEAELLKKMSHTMNVTILVPMTEWIHSYQATLSAYSVLDVDTSSKVATFEYNSHVNGQKRLSFKKVTTQLSEVQDVTAVVRRWIQEHKIQPEKIAISAPDIGEYWPVLSTYLKLEGVPAARGLYSTLKTIPYFHTWIAELKTHSGDIDFHNIEAENFNHTQNIPCDYDKFYSTYKNIYSLDEFKKDNQLSEKYKNQVLRPTQKVSLTSFLSWSLDLWKHSDSELLQGLLNRLYQDFPENAEFAQSEWIDILDHLASKVEVQVEPADAFGIQCLDLVSLKDVHVTHVAVLGLSDSALRKTSATLLQTQDISYLRDQYGFHLAQVEKSDLEFELYWLLQDKDKQFELYFPQVNFKSQQLAPSRVWFLGASEESKGRIPLHMPLKSRVSSLQNNYQMQNDIFSKRLQRDLEGAKEPWFSLRSPRMLSASQIEDYLKCPFINASKKLYSLSDLPDLDLDIDYMTRGNLLHRAAELIYKENPQFQVTTSQIENIVDFVSLEYKSKIKDSELWQSQRKFYIKILQNFVKFELALRSEFSALKTLGVEKDFVMSIEPHTGNLLKGEQAGCVLLRGRIDRIDVDDNNELALIVDYKFDISNDHKNFDSWIKENQLQLLLYMMAVERGALENSFRVVGSMYYSFKKSFRGKGYLDSEVDGILYKTTKAKNKGTEEDKLELYAEVQKRILLVIDQMSKGSYEPNPAKLETCHKCQWRTLCRAPHLN